MKTTKQLYEKYSGGRTQDVVAAELGVKRNTISMACKAERFSPTLAVKMALALGQEPAHWALVALLEQAPAKDRVYLHKALKIM